jgi:hypothetical protein
MRSELTSITTHEANDGEELTIIKYFSFYFNFPEKKRKKRGSGMSGIDECFISIQNPRGR